METGKQEMNMSKISKEELTEKQKEVLENIENMSEEEAVQGMIQILKYEGIFKQYGKRHLVLAFVVGLLFMRILTLVL
jgi:hypothetical protein